MACSKYKSTKETINFARLSRLLVDICADVLRKVLDKRIPQRQFAKEIVSLKHRIFHLLNTKEKKILYPSGRGFTGAYNDFDISLLYKLLRNIGNIAPPTTGWGIIPNPADRSPSAHIERIHIFKNDVYSHVLAATISDSDFKAVWDELALTVEELEQILLPGQTYFKDAVAKLLVETIDPETERLYIQKLEEWRDEIFGVRSEVEGVKNDLDKMKRDLNEETLEWKIQVHIERNMIKAERTKETGIRSSRTRNVTGNTLGVIEKHSKNKAFVKTAAVDRGIDVLNKNGILIYSGSNGSGKTTNAIEVMRHVYDKDKEISLVELDDLTQWHDHVNIDIKTLVLLDDIFNNSILNQGDRYWKFILACVEEGNVQVVATMGTNFLNENQSHLENHSLFDSKHFVHLTEGEYKLSFHEKQFIFESYCNLYNIIICDNRKDENNETAVRVNIHRRTMYSIIATDAIDDFPRMCFRFCANLKYTRLGEDFFKNPSESHVKEMSEKRKSGDLYKKRQYCVLAYISLHNGEINLRNINETLMNKISVSLDLPTLRTEQIEELLKDMKNQYVIQSPDPDIYVHKHETISEAVGLSLGQCNTKLVLEYCNWQFLRKYVRTENYQPKESEVVLRVRPENFEILVDRIISFLKYKGSDYLAIHDVVALSVMCDDSFLSYFKEILQVSDQYSQTFSDNYINLFKCSVEISNIPLMKMLYSLKTFRNLLTNHTLSCLFETGCAYIRVKSLVWLFNHTDIAGIKLD